MVCAGIAVWATPLCQPMWLYSSSFLILMNVYAGLACDALAWPHLARPFWAAWGLSVLSVLLHATTTSLHMRGVATATALCVGWWLLLGRSARVAW